MLDSIRWIATFLVRRCEYPCACCTAAACCLQHAYRRTFGCSGSACDDGCVLPGRLFGLCVCSVVLVCSAPAMCGNVPVARVVALCALRAGEYATQPVSLRCGTSLDDRTERSIGICALAGIRAHIRIGTLEGAVAVACNLWYRARRHRCSHRCVSTRCFTALGGHRRQPDGVGCKLCVGVLHCLGASARAAIRCRPDNGARHALGSGAVCACCRVCAGRPAATGCDEPATVGRDCIPGHRYQRCWLGALVCAPSANRSKPACGVQ